MLDVQGLTKRFGGLTAVGDVSFQVREGDVVGLIGPNGAGKTTLFNMVAGVFAPTAGRVLFRGEEIAGRPPHEIAHRGILRTFQNIRLFPELSVRANVYAGGVSFFRSGWLSGILGLASAARDQRALQERVTSMLTEMGIADLADLPAGTLPYGHQRRVEIARALASHPALLLLDEPTAGMNPQETAEVMELIGRIRKNGITVLVIEHDMNLIMGICDRIVVLQNGQKIAEGTPDEIKASPTVIEAYLGSGFANA